MYEIKRIVVPLDLEQHTAKLVDFALDIAAGFDSELSFFHGIEFVATGEMALGNFSYDDYNTARKTQAQQKMEEIVQECSRKCKGCSGKVAIGDVVDEIVDYAREQNADLIIIGSHGKRGLEKILLGSIAERVIKRAHCPTLVMNPYR